MNVPHSELDREQTAAFGTNVHSTSRGVEIDYRAVYAVLIKAYVRTSVAHLSSNEHKQKVESNHE